MADALVLGASTSVCGFKSHLPHQTKIIRTRSFLWERGSDYLFISRSSKIRTSGTVSSSGPPPNQEAQERKSQIETGVCSHEKVSQLCV